MRVLIVEDEEMARKSLIRSLEQNYPQIQIVGCTGSVSETVAWLKAHGSNGAGMHGGWKDDNGVDIIFMDVELSDGNCFEIFKQTEVKAKIIMTTAFDTYAIKAFEAGSIDYLLKPINPADLHRAVSRAMEKQTDINAIIKQLGLGEEKKKERLIVRINDRIVPVRIDEIAYFYSEEKSNFLCTFANKRYIVDSSLDIIAEELPDSFFRISRGCIVSIKAIQSIVKQANGRMLVVADPAAGFEMTVSRARAEDFLSWISK